MTEAQSIKACESIPLSSGKLYGIGEAKNLKYAEYIIHHFVFVSRQKYFPNDFFSKRFFKKKLKKHTLRKCAEHFLSLTLDAPAFRKMQLQLRRVLGVKY